MTTQQEKTGRALHGLDTGGIVTGGIVTGGIVTGGIAPLWCLESTGRMLSHAPAGFRREMP